MVTHMNRPDHKPILLLLATTLLLGAALAGCLGQDAEATGSGALYVKDDLTDDAAEVHITFNQAEALSAGGGGWTTVYEGEQSFEMLSLSGPDDKAKLADFELEPGEYLQLRIAITNVTVVDHEGNETAYTSFGNVVTIAHGFTVSEGGDFELLVDFDLEQGVNLENREYTPVIGFAQTTYGNDNGNGTNNTHRTDRPEQSNAMDHRGIHGVCTGWENTQRDSGNGTAGADNNTTSDNETSGPGNSTAFRWLHEQAAAANQTVESYCAEQSRPGAPDNLKDVLPEQMPEQARHALEDRQLGPGAQQSGDRAPDDRGAEGARGNETEERGQQSGATGAGNQTGQGNGQGGPPE